MDKNKIVINGQEFVRDAVQIPGSGRVFREAWNPPEDGVISVNISKAKQIVVDTLNRWRNWKTARPFKFKGVQFANGDADKAQHKDCMEMLEAGIDVPDFHSIEGKAHKASKDFLDGWKKASLEHIKGVGDEHSKLLKDAEKAVKAEDDKKLAEIVKMLKEEMDE
jgi:hypothetical protein